MYSNFQYCSTFFYLYNLIFHLLLTTSEMLPLLAMLNSPKDNIIFALNLRGKYYYFSQLEFEKVIQKTLQALGYSRKKIASSCLADRILDEP